MQADTAQFVRARGFTLVELLVVIAIIAILMGLTLNGLAGGREYARRTVCMSNQRQISIAMITYANTYQDFVPREGTVLDPRGERARLSWAVALRPFLDERAGPDTDMEDRFVSAEYYLDPSRPRDVHPIHYVTNALPFLSPGLIDPLARFDHRYRRGFSKLASMANPSKTIYLGEFTDDPGNVLWTTWNPGPRDIDVAQFYDLWTTSHVTQNHPEIRIAPRRHGNGGNVLFFDGHVEQVEAQRLVDLNTWDDGDYGSRRGP